MQNKNSARYYKMALPLSNRISSLNKRCLSVFKIASCSYSYSNKLKKIAAGPGRKWEFDHSEHMKSSKKLTAKEVDNLHPEYDLSLHYPKEVPKGRIAQKLPFKILLEKDKRYSWCTCGSSNSQPFCDGEHRKIRQNQAGNSLRQYDPKPLRFTVDETKEYWLCRCKQTKNKPFCDGSHQSDEVKLRKIRVGPNF